MASAKHQPPFRAEHIGSLLRPDDLLEARAQIRDGKSPEQVNLEPIEKKAVDQIVKTQLECGLRAVTTGLFFPSSRTPRAKLI
jgi:methionine synthase II (cobalamin-independent)